MFTSHGFRQRIAIATLLFMFILSGCGNNTSPTITSFSPSGGTVGTAVTIIGTNFDTMTANNTVAFNGTPAVVTSVTSTEIVAAVPFGATTGPISVTVNGQSQTATSSTNFSIMPTITSISPSSGSANTVVTITGTGFDTTTANNTVLFNGTTAVVTSSNSSTIVTAVPSGATSGQITVTVNGQSAISSTTFTVN